MNNELLSYFSGDSLAAEVWFDKYAVKDTQGNATENLPSDMHLRMAKEFARKEVDYQELESKCPKIHTDQLSVFGQKLYQRRLHQTYQEIVDEVFLYFSRFGQIVPQGSLMANLGNNYVFGSLSNCFGIAPPFDSIAGILRTDEHIAQLEKRRGGVGTHLNNLRPTDAFVSNSAKSSTGVPAFAGRFSNTTREIAQAGRRGALMLLLSVKHPDIFKFVTMKDDKTKVTGANVSVMLTNEFMEAVLNSRDFYCRFPISTNLAIVKEDYEYLEYNKLVNVDNGISIMRIKAKELFDLIAEMAWKNGEPGIAFVDSIQDYSPDGVYEMYCPELCNPCGEQWFHRNETCRLIALNYLCAVINPYTPEAKLDLTKLYEVAYMQQRLGDDLVDLEVEYIDRILNKLDADPEPLDIKQVEIKLWEDIKKIAKEGRRTGSGFTALGDLFAALGIRYGSEESIDVAGIISQCKMEAELDATIDMALLRGTFTGWNKNKEFKATSNGKLAGNNTFYQTICEQFPIQAAKMLYWGRRNVSWSNVAPTGTVSIMTQTTGGLEPVFKAFYFRNRKVLDNGRFDFVDQNGDRWIQYAVLHPQFKKWIDIATDFRSDGLTKDKIEQLFEQSPWYGSEANDIPWESRIKLQSVIQQYTSNAISSTINLPNNVEQDVVRNIYAMAWRYGLKGITVYRDGCRTGVLVGEAVNSQKDEFGYTDSIKRPDTLEGHYFPILSEGKEYGIIIGLLNGKPYEVFAIPNPIFRDKSVGEIVKRKEGDYSFTSGRFNIEHLQFTQAPTDIQVLTRFTSGMLRHGMNPKYVAEQIDKSNVSVVSFSKAIARTLKQYVPNEDTGEECTSCGEHTIVRQEGCLKCSSCGYSKC